MYRRYLCLEVVILLILSHVGWNDPSSLLSSCSRDRSQIVRSIIQKKFLPILERYRVTLPLDCPFHSHRDVFWWPASINQVDEEWRCPVCGARFACEERLTHHWDGYHAASSKKPEDAVCLADFCDIMRCDVVGVLLRGGRARKPGEHLQDQGGRLPLIQPPHTSQDTGNSEQAQQKPSPEVCNENLMFTLQNKCKAAIRQCTVGLLATLSLKDFQDIEDELNKAVCSYLTCEKFWDDSLQQVRHVPVLLCVIIGVIMVGGFCVCYYIVWILFDSPACYEEVCSNGIPFTNFDSRPASSNYVVFRNQAPGRSGRTSSDRISSMMASTAPRHRNAATSMMTDHHSSTPTPHSTRTTNHPIRHASTERASEHRHHHTRLPRR